MTYFNVTASGIPVATVPSVDWAVTIAQQYIHANRVEITAPGIHVLTDRKETPKQLKERIEAALNFAKTR